MIKLTNLSIQKKIPVVISRGNPYDDDVKYQIENINISGEFSFNNVCDFKDFINMLKKN